MLEITITDYRGQEHSGKWNGKTYSSKVEAQPDLYRIYLDDVAFHITYEELERLTNNAKKEQIIRTKQIADDFLTKFKDFEIEEKIFVLATILNDGNILKFFKENGMHQEYYNLASCACENTDMYRYIRR